jgi:hypothetical protein
VALISLFRTGDKLASPEDREPESSSCVLCSGQLDNVTEEPGSLQATLLSRLISQKSREAFQGRLEEALQAVHE